MKVIRQHRLGLLILTAIIAICGGLVLVNSMRQKTLNEYYGRGVKDFNDGKYPESIENFNSALANRPLISTGQQLSNVFFYKCIAHRLVKQHSAAIDSCDRAIEILPDRSPGIGLVLEVDSVKINSIQKNSPAAGASWLVVGDRIIRIDDIDISEMGSTQATELIHSAKIDRDIKIVTSSKPGQESIHQLRPLTLPNNRKSLAYYHRGLARISDPKERNYPAAILDFDGAIKLNPDVADYYIARARAKSGSNQQEAIGDLNQAITLNPKSAAAYYELGLIHEAQNTPELRQQAISDFLD